ncbi:hypothetical protein C7413_15115 [Paraburkholderia silvatlantica]|nr:hypothetical protein C7413_15115 [Paraburkholderia silvatlantica]
MLDKDANVVDIFLNRVLRVVRTRAQSTSAPIRHMDGEFVGHRESELMVIPCGPHRALNKDDTGSIAK